MMFQMGGIGPMFGQLGFFHKFAGKDIPDPRPRQRYADEAKRLLNVLNDRIEGLDWLMGADYSIADMATWPWVRALDFYEAHEIVEFERFEHVHAWMARALDRPASQRALNIPDRNG